MQTYIDILPKVEQALKDNKPVVALESTIISHGMPWPENFAMAKKVEAIIEKEGAVPATIAILDGRIKVGLNTEMLRRLAKDEAVIKASKRDIAYLLANKKNGATTVSGTTLIAALAGIKVFATGGIGGVHRAAERTFDISRDLQELAVSQVAVVCAGVKSILDIPKTLEYLETSGVTVLGYQTDTMPEFYTCSGEFPLDYRVDTPEELAGIMHATWSLGLETGLVIANPVPKKASLDKTYIDDIIKNALKAADKAGITGKAITPYLLGEIKQMTKGASLEANLALVYNNALLAAHVAKAYAKNNL